MIKNKKISLVIPCKNEEKIIGATIKRVPSYVDEIIVVDNGSTDNSAQAAREAGAIVVTENRKMNGVGYGYAHIAGIKKATGDYIFAMDADDTYPSYQIGAIAHFMDDNDLDVVSCNRLPLYNKKAINPTRRLGIYILNLEVTLLYRTKMRDILTGMWAINRRALPKLNLRMGDWNLSPEIKVSAITNKDIKFSEYHIDHFIREQEPSKQAIWNTGTSHLLYILKRRFTEDSRLGGLVYQILNRNWKRPAFAGQKSFFTL